MKRILATLTPFLIMALVCVGFTACSSDDDGNGGGSGTLTGSWVETRIEGWEIDSRVGKQDLTENIPAKEACVLTFKSDGTCTEVSPSGRSTSMSGPYSYNASNKTLTIEGGHTYTFKVETLTSTKLSLVDSGEEHYIKTIYKRK
ncbi:MAG: lipocalin family protein [Prevotella sp.]|nr:lipocalin family protein [Prevotella sp.]